MSVEITMVARTETGRDRISSRIATVSAYARVFPYIIKTETPAS
jgi:hypothetical protein